MSIGTSQQPSGDDAPSSPVLAAGPVGQTAPVGPPEQQIGQPTEQPTEPVAERPEPRGSRLDEWWGHLLRTPGRRRLWYWGGPIAVTLLAAVLRLWNLASPHSLVFDETFYVKDAYTLLNNGYESQWPAGADERFNSGDTDIFSDEGSFVVHPPLGKWVIALGLAAFGADNSFGWRIGTVVVGVLAVFLLTVIARRLFASTIVAVIVGFLFAIDGHAIVMSRVALLDGILMFFALLGFGAILLDRTWHEKRLRAWLAERQARVDAGLATESSWGPGLWWRPWLLAAGLAFGMAASVKWSGLYFLAAFGVYVVVVDALARRRAGVAFWASAAVLKQGPISFLLMVPIALATFIASWTGWFLTAGGYYRSWASEAGNAWTGALAWVPESVQSFWHYQVAAYEYHVGLSTPHPYQANPLTWLFMTRPTSMYYKGSSLGEDGCLADLCSAAIHSVANPLIWWAAAAAAFYLLYRLARYREWQTGLILMGVAAGYLPWLMYLNRTVYQFYTIAFEPYLLLGLGVVIAVILGRRDNPRWRRQRGIGVVAVYLSVAALVSAFFYPIWTAQLVPYWFWHLHMWLPSWV
ncbi:dolichyl-phosphate-mannose--protein mannosyltransferase [Microterricola viridarii]|uniref:Polyprenol-phosphate-mannose--protein mannosyltransferase n=1 Tax=Microterricola viridarii TaxID=412690 RepID=A0A1H1XZ38_9MICO|nr:phospholipid carrier-dependent glycosyltransferase [Microterricola viridarii]SDT14026.1 Dolichyl-phosphate-mannose-protein mannosyltransferase [Microterricola viridarii]